MAHKVTHLFTCDRCSVMVEQQTSEKPTGWTSLYHNHHPLGVMVCESCNASYRDWWEETERSFARWLAREGK